MDEFMDQRKPKIIQPILAHSQPDHRRAGATQGRRTIEMRLGQMRLNYDSNSTVLQELYRGRGTVIHPAEPSYIAQ
jgi:transposase InsO family protein